MSAWLIAGVGVIYLLVALALVAEERPWLAVTFLGYAIGNVGLYMVAR